VPTYRLGDAMLIGYMRFRNQMPRNPVICSATLWPPPALIARRSMKTVLQDGWTPVLALRPRSKPFARRYTRGMET
jgi:hypothetical protein